MIVYHGTTEMRAKRICAEGFQPRKPTGRVWFAENWSYAYGRAKTQAHRAKDRPAVLTCDINVKRLRAEFGARCVFHRHGAVAIRGRLPVTVVRSYVGGRGVPTSPRDIARWVNDILRLPAPSRVDEGHPGVRRLFSWVVHRRATQPGKHYGEAELLFMARRWMSDVFEGREVNPGAVHGAYRVTTIHVDVNAGMAEARKREEHALELLEAPKAKQRIKGLRVLKDLDEPDLFEWCALCLDDRSVEVRAAALHTMLSCRDIDPEFVEPHADSEDKRVRAFATAVLAKYGGDASACWLERGLKDPCAYVRVETARQLSVLDPVEHRVVFELALYDTNRTVSRYARKLIEGKGYHELRW